MKAPEHQEQLALCLLAALYELGRADLPATPTTLGAAIDLPESEIQVLLSRLDAQSLVDEATCRLTMKGLVLAVSHSGSLKVAKHAA